MIRTSVHVTLFHDPIRYAVHSFGTSIFCLQYLLCTWKPAMQCCQNYVLKNIQNTYNALSCSYEIVTNTILDTWSLIFNNKTVLYYYWRPCFYLCSFHTVYIVQCMHIDLYDEQATVLMTVIGYWNQNLRRRTTFSIKMPSKKSFCLWNTALADYHDTENHAYNIYSMA